MLGAAAHRPAVEAVVIGASAGALSALGVLLPVLTARPTLPIIIVVHLSARQPSLLVEVCSRKTAWPVREPYHGQPVEPGIWFCPPNYHLLIETSRTFAYSIGEPVNYSRPAIDLLFQSAADAYGASLVGMVLTGASADGSRGAKSIVDAGGFMAVQDPTNAECPVMPTEAIARSNPQLIAPLEEMATFLSKLTRSGS